MAKRQEPSRPGAALEKLAASGETSAAVATGRAWRPHPRVATAVSGVLVAFPLVASLAAGLAVAGVLPRGLLSIGAAVAVGVATATLARWALVWATPLPGLYRLSLAFPDRLPTRFAVALRSSSVTRATTTAGSATSLEEAIELVAALTKHDPRLRGHSERVRAYTELIAAELHLPAADRSPLAWSALLHDVGKLRVPRTILDKTDELAPDEWEIMRSHTEQGALLVASLGRLLGPWALAVPEHHERWDGSGYPRGLTGRDISFAGRIVAVADAFDVMTSNRSYQRARSIEEARAELLACAGTQFDPDVVRAMLAVRLPALRTIVGLPAVLIAMSTAVRMVFERARLEKLAAPASAGAAAATAAVVLTVLGAPTEEVPPAKPPPTALTVPRPAPPPPSTVAPTIPAPSTTPTFPNDPPGPVAEPTTLPPTTLPPTTLPTTTTTRAPAPRLRTPLPALRVSSAATTIDLRDLLVDPGEIRFPAIVFGPSQLGDIHREPDGSFVFTPEPGTSGFEWIDVRLADDPEVSVELPVVVLHPPNGARLTVSTAADRTGAIDLAGTVPAGPVAITAEPGAGMVEARFFVDDPLRRSPPRQVERVLAFDFGGTEPDGSASLVTLPPGRHTLTVEVTLASGASWLLIHEVVVPTPP